jgi:hypothetical protein
MNGKVLNNYKVNAKWLIIGLILLLSGYTLMGWNVGSALPYEAKVFALNKLTIAPIVLIMGYIAIGLSIMTVSRKKKNKPATNVWF